MFFKALRNHGGFTDPSIWKKRAWLEEKPFVVGTFVQLSDPMVIEILSSVGFDFVIIDFEHGPLGIDSARLSIIACNASGIVPIVRIKENAAPLVTEVLDSGAIGVQIPQICTPGDAKRAVFYSKYHPMGGRGINPYVRASGYSPELFRTYMTWANENHLVIIHVEGLEGVKNIDAILDTPGLDIVFLGPYDLSQSAGVPGEVEHPTVIQKMKEVIAKAHERNMVVGTFADNEAAAKKWIDLGVRYIVVGYDTRMLFHGANKVVSSLRH
jgi:4-hydroxy-2-oxoheptanedioate aldolase